MPFSKEKGGKLEIENSDVEVGYFYVYSYGYNPSTDSLEEDNIGLYAKASFNISIANL